MNEVTTGVASRTRAVFVATQNALAPVPGGVQVYTRELLDILAAAGFELSVVDYTPDRRPLTRVRRKLRPRPYADRVPPVLVDRIAERQRETGSEWIFLNGVDLAAIGRQLRERIPAARIALFSFGLESVDYLHEARASETLSSDRSALRLGRQLAAECEQRMHLDHVFCMAPFEAEVERWLGAKQVTAVPRTIAPGAPLEWQPMGNRLGCVGTFDHPPNAEGLRLFLEQFEQVAPAGYRFRLVGGPPAATHSLISGFRNVDYLGALDDAALRTEASSWSCFVHPVFCYARGASTKVAVALSWRVPIATTPAGIRGYEWLNGGIHAVDTPRELARESVRLMEPRAGAAALDLLHDAARAAPSVQELGALVRNQLLA